MDVVWLSFSTFLEINISYRFTTPSPETFNKMMKKLNILSESTVIMYNGISAAKAWFIMKYYGHPSTMILDGGIREWKRLDYPINTMKTPVDYTSAPVKTFTAKEPNTSMVIEYEEVLKKVGSKSIIQYFLTTLVRHH